MVYREKLTDKQSEAIAKIWEEVGIREPSDINLDFVLRVLKVKPEVFENRAGQEKQNENQHRRRDQNR